jgi:hypothetical protein
MVEPAISPIIGTTDPQKTGSTLFADVVLDGIRRRDNTQHRVAISSLDRA